MGAIVQCEMQSLEQNLLEIMPVESQGVQRALLRTITKLKYDKNVFVYTCSKSKNFR
ncbi:hypothetical protein BWQ96_03587 [Gracilariopsis chorda]|uniref:Uncharacterized protein n=1 Tax=Gracilariopsis chorda TaxID=448386 RepID=A0A2V3IWS1_9FLOR|nr:hypothetical protein BWQ96_03587 [Gracilariopsis chorda]|eukprot:PXF46598.1 hypothetical protein BWQ96_03587 [Gracilariopsis chorda]